MFCIFLLQYFGSSPGMTIIYRPLNINSLNKSTGSRLANAHLCLICCLIQTSRFVFKNVFNNLLFFKLFSIYFIFVFKLILLTIWLEYHGYMV